MNQNTADTSSQSSQLLKDKELENLHNFYHRVFETMEKLIARHESFGNWSFGGGIPQLSVLPTQTELGLWYAEKSLVGFTEPIAISLALLPNECRVGLFLPNICLRHESADYITLDETIMNVYGEKIPGVHVFSRKGSDRTLFDHVFHEPPFDVETLSKAMLYVQGSTQYAVCFQMIVQRLGYIITTIWTGAIKAVYENGKTGVDTWFIWVEENVQILPSHIHGLSDAVLLRSNFVGNKVAVEIRTTDKEETIRAYFEKIGIPVIDLTKMEAF